MNLVNLQLLAQLSRSFSFLWNYLVIFFSFVINIFMLSTWMARFSLDDVSGDVTELNDTIYDRRPRIDIMEESTYNWTFFSLALVHNACTLTLFVAFIIADRPRLGLRPLRILLG